MACQLVRMAETNLIGSDIESGELFEFGSSIDLPNLHKDEDVLKAVRALVANEPELAAQVIEKLDERKWPNDVVPQDENGAGLPAEFDVSSMTGEEEKAAILLLSLNENDAAGIIRHLEPKQVQRVGNNGASERPKPRQSVWCASRVSRRHPEIHQHRYGQRRLYA